MPERNRSMGGLNFVQQYVNKKNLYNIYAKTLEDLFKLEIYKMDESNDLAQNLHFMSTIMQDYRCKLQLHSKQVQKVKFGHGIDIKVLDKFTINQLPNKTIEYNGLDIIIQILQFNAIQQCQQSPTCGWGYIHKYKSHRNCNQCFIFHVFVSKIILILHIFKIHFDDNIFNIWWKHVQYFEMNLMKFDISKTSINHCN